MVYLTEFNAEAGHVHMSTACEKGKEFRVIYSSGKPFPHIVIDEFISPDILEMCLDEFNAISGKEGMAFDRDQERLKIQYAPDKLSPASRSLFYTFNSRSFVEIIENITGISGLIPDPYFIGSGLHEIHNGGHLSVHADFNHHKLLNLERRVNVLIYLNKDWDKEFGGQLELWEDDMSSCVHSIVPAFNRCVIFNTTSTSNHGNPNPVAHPRGISRKSIALYYYTATWSPEKRSHSTNFRARRGTTDRVDWPVKMTELYNDLLPPVVSRGVARLQRKLRRANPPAA